MIRWSQWCRLQRFHICLCNDSWHSEGDGVDNSISIFGRVMVHDTVDEREITVMLSHVIIDRLCFSMNREERRHRRRELYRLRRERETAEEKQERLYTWPLQQFYSVRTRHEMDDILDVNNACKSRFDWGYVHIQAFLLLNSSLNGFMRSAMLGEIFPVDSLCSGNNEVQNAASYFYRCCFIWSGDTIASYSFWSDNIVKNFDGCFTKLALFFVQSCNSWLNILKGCLPCSSWMLL